MEGDEYTKGDLSTGTPKPLKQTDPNFSYYGWSYMPPTTWTVPQRRAPICLGDKEKVADAIFQNPEAEEGLFDKAEKLFGLEGGTIH